MVEVWMGKWKPQGASTRPLEKSEEFLLCLPLVYLFSNKLNEAIDTHGVQLFSWETSLWSRNRPGNIGVIIFVCVVVSQEAWLAKGVMMKNRKCFMGTMTDDMQHFLENFDSLPIMKFLFFTLSLELIWISAKKCKTIPSEICIINSQNDLKVVNLKVCFI